MARSKVGVVTGRTYGTAGTQSGTLVSPCISSHHKQSVTTFIQKHHNNVPAPPYHPITTSSTPSPRRFWRGQTCTNHRASLRILQTKKNKAIPTSTVQPRQNTSTSDISRLRDEREGEQKHPARFAACHSLPPPAVQHSNGVSAACRLPWMQCASRTASAQLESVVVGRGERANHPCRPPKAHVNPACLQRPHGVWRGFM